MSATVATDEEITRAAVEMVRVIKQCAPANAGYWQ
jgi:hypothetical protein